MDYLGSKISSSEFDAKLNRLILGVVVSFTIKLNHVHADMSCFKAHWSTWLVLVFPKASQVGLFGPYAHVSYVTPSTLEFCLRRMYVW